MSVKAVVMELCNKTNTKVGTLERKASLSNGTINRWTDDTIPNGATLKSIADFFGVSVDYLLGRGKLEKQENRDEPDLWEIRERLRRQPGMRLLFDASKGATEEQLIATAKMIEEWKQ